MSEIRVVTCRDTFPQANGTPIVDGVSTTDTGHVYQVYGGAEVWNHGVRFTAFIAYLAEVFVRVGSMNHEVSVVVQAVPTDWALLCARHLPDDPPGSDPMIMVEINPYASVVSFFIGGDPLPVQPTDQVPYVAQVGDTWTLRVVDAVAQFLVNGVALLTLDLTPWGPAMLNPANVKCGISAYDTTARYGPFTVTEIERTISVAQVRDVSPTIGVRVLAPPTPISR